MNSGLNTLRGRAILDSFSATPNLRNQHPNCPVQWVQSKPSFSWYEPQAKEHYINQQIDILVTSLQDRNAQFYLHRNMETMYVDGQVIDLFRKNDVLDYLKQVDLLPEAYARDVVELFRTRINQFYTVIPLSGIGTVNGIKQPRPKMTRYLASAEVNWLQHVVESGVLTQKQGVQQ